MGTSKATDNIGPLTYDIILNELHFPLVDGKANRENIEDAITVAILSGEIDYIVDQEMVDLAISVIDDLIGRSAPRT
jgi:hypothetical protein